MGRGGRPMGRMPTPHMLAAMGLARAPTTEKDLEHGAGNGGHLSFGVASMQGWRDQQEDAHLALPDFDAERKLGLFGVFDGHGGAAVAAVVAEKLPAMLRDSKLYSEGKYEEAFVHTFKAIDQHLGSPKGWRDVMKRSGGEGPDGMGCTAVVALIQRACADKAAEVIVANAGDSRSVLVAKRQAQNMSRDHGPLLPDEHARVKKAGGFVNKEGRINGNLNLSRALGDLFYKKNKKLKPEEQLISGVPEVKRRVLNGSDTHLILGCDGIWERATSQKVTDFLLGQLSKPWDGRPHLATACASFLDSNISANPLQTGGLGCDNMTLLLVDLAAALSSDSSDSSRPAGTSSSESRKASESRKVDAAASLAEGPADTSNGNELTDVTVQRAGSRLKRCRPSGAWQSSSQRRRLTLSTMLALRSRDSDVLSESWMRAAEESVSEALKFL
eukprot:TRINITY_DN113456_c0_g1_i1.p1 TRINITY_DN113456_c0_g1~~TRINITY_DN113456_c0_g1_i1.p1  ORF type:complete len:444 (+),score=68.22 TRINITY_DN113456_c0_g1_i1:95-1426(+)